MFFGSARAKPKDQYEAGGGFPEFPDLRYIYLAIYKGYIYLETQIGAPGFDWSLGLVLWGWHSKIEVIWETGPSMVEFIVTVGWSIPDPSILLAGSSQFVSVVDNHD